MSAPFCTDCPDREACGQGAPCTVVRRINTPTRCLDCEAKSADAERRLHDEWVRGLPDGTRVSVYSATEDRYYTGVVEPLIGKFNRFARVPGRRIYETDRLVLTHPSNTVLYAMPPVVVSPNV